jgi:hypothetical protein
MTPAEKPRAVARNFVFVFLAKKASALPTPVLHPAKSVSSSAKRKDDDGIYLTFYRYGAANIRYGVANIRLFIGFSGAGRSFFLGVAQGEIGFAGG